MAVLLFFFNLRYLSLCYQMSCRFLKLVLLVQWSMTKSNRKHINIYHVTQYYKYVVYCWNIKSKWFFDIFDFAFC